jgi:hypothetical protein
MSASSKDRQRTTENFFPIFGTIRIDFVTIRRDNALIPRPVIRGGLLAAGDFPASIYTRSTRMTSSLNGTCNIAVETNLGPPR